MCLTLKQRGVSISWWPSHSLTWNLGLMHFAESVDCTQMTVSGDVMYIHIFQHGF